MMVLVCSDSVRMFGSMDGLSKIRKKKVRKNFGVVCKIISNLWFVWWFVWLLNKGEISGNSISDRSVVISKVVMFSIMVCYSLG